MDRPEAARRPPFGANPTVGDRGTRTQRRIVRAAVTVFRDVGYHEARVEAITEAAGCSRPSLYQYFAGKEGLFRHLAAELAVEMVQLGGRLDAVDAGPDGLEHLRRWLAEFASLYDRYAPVFGGFSAALRDDPDLGSGAHDIGQRFGRALATRSPGDGDGDGDGEAVGDTGAGGVDVDTVAGIVVTMVVRCNLYRDAFEGALHRGRFVDDLARLVHRTLFGRQPDVNDRRRRRDALPSLDGPVPSGVGVGADAAVRLLRPQGAATRRRILDAGARLLSSRGYHETRIDDVCARAGASHGSFYRYFANKEALFAALAERSSAAMVEQLDRFPPVDDTAALRAWFLDWFATYRRHGGVLLAWQEVQFTDSEAREVSQRVWSEVLGRLATIVAPWGPGAGSVEALALLALLERVPYSVQVLGAGPEATAIDAVVAVVQRGVASRPAAAVARSGAGDRPRGADRSSII